MKRSLVILCTALILISGLFSSRTASAATDTVFVLSLEINMTRAITRGIFNPALDKIYVTFDSVISDQMLVPVGDNKYSLLLNTGIDSGAVYNFRFRINNFIIETVNRQILIRQGINSYYCWWNNDFLNYTWFRVDMGYMVKQHTFRPDTDYVDMVGNMNSWKGSPIFTRSDTGFIYQTLYNIDPGTIAVFKFRINGDTNRIELKGLPNRFLLAPDSVIHTMYWFNNYNPSRTPMIFYCNMKYMTRAGHFSRQYDHVDVAGSFNGNGAYDILYDTDKDSIYTATLLIDTAVYRQNPISFKYRINSSWPLAELQGKPARTWFLHDTATGRNIDSSWFNDWNPAIPAPPMATKVAIQGLYAFKQVISGVYTYENINGIREGVSKYQWYRSDDSLGINITIIDTATHITFTVDTASIHKWLVFEVIPIADSGEATTGDPVRVITKSSIGYVGITNHDNLVSLVYPNPGSGNLVVEGLVDIKRIELYDLTGRMVFALDGINSTRTLINPSGLLPGMYLLKAYGKDNETGRARVIRN